MKLNSDLSFTDIKRFLSSQLRVIGSFFCKLYRQLELWFIEKNLQNIFRKKKRYIMIYHIKYDEHSNYCFPDYNRLGLIFHRSEIKEFAKQNDVFITDFICRFRINKAYVFFYAYDDGSVEDFVYMINETYDREIEIDLVNKTTDKTYIEGKY